MVKNAKTDDLLGTTLGRYRIERLAGEGGMARVYLAKLVGDHGFQKKVAVKILHPEYSTDRSRVSMFIDEVRVSSRIQNVNVCTVFDFGIHDGMPYLVMEFLEGAPLSRVLRRRRGKPIAIEPRIAARIVADAAQGLHAAHELVGDDGQPLGVIHRDVSPQNIFVLSEGAVKVLDFGIAKMRGRLSETRHTVFKGKPCYAAPEQFGGAPIDRRADVWALGVILWETTTGSRLFSRTSFTDALEKIVNEPVARPRDLVQGYPAELEDIVLSALERDPSRRIPTAMALAERLGEFIYSTGKLTGSQQLSTFLAERLATGKAASTATDVGKTTLAKRSPTSPSNPLPQPLETPSPDDLDRPLSGQGFDPTVSISTPGQHQPPAHLQAIGPSLPQVSPPLGPYIDEATKPFIQTPESSIRGVSQPERRARKLSSPLILVILLVGLGTLALFGTVAVHFFQQRQSPDISEPRPHLDSLVGVTSHKNTSELDDGQNSALVSPADPTDSGASHESQFETTPHAESDDLTPDASIAREENNEDFDFVFRGRGRRPPSRQGSQKNRDDEIPTEAETEAEIDDGASTSQSGSLNLLAVPQSDVYWRGRKIGRTPLFEYSLPTGQHALELRALNGESRHTVRLSITAGNTTRRTVRY